MCVCVYLDFNDGDRDRRVNEEPQCVRGVTWRLARAAVNSSSKMFAYFLLKVHLCVTFLSKYTDGKNVTKTRIWCVRVERVSRRAATDVTGKRTCTTDTRTGYISHFYNPTFQVRYQKKKEPSRNAPRRAREHRYARWF